MTALRLGRAAFWWRLAFGLGAVAAFALGCVGFHRYLPGQPGFTDHTVADVVYYSLQLFVLDPTPLNGGGPYPLTLEVARFLAPATTAFALLEALRVVLREQWRGWATARLVGHTVVCGEGPAALLLAKRLRRANGRPVVLVNPAPDDDVARQHGLVKVAGDPRDRETLCAAGIVRAGEIFACTGSSAVNAGVVLTARQCADGPVPLAAYAETLDGELCLALRARHIGMAADPGFRLNFFALSEIAARVLLDQFPVTDSGPPFRVRIVGFNSFARALLREIRRRSSAEDSWTVTVVTDDAARVAEFARRAGMVGAQCRVITHSDLGVDQSPSVTYVCLTNEDEAMRVGLHAARVGEETVVICLPQRGALRDALTGDARGPLLDDIHGRLRIFGVLDEACEPHLVRNDLIDLLARTIHAQYVEQRRAEGEEPQLSHLPWARLPDHLKRSNVAQAEHIGVKLAAVGCTVVPAIADGEPFEFTESELNVLARLEHERWVAERTAAGFSPGPIRTASQHPDLVDWDELGETDRDKDREVVRFLPRLLQRAGLRIFRLPPLC